VEHGHRINYGDSAPGLTHVCQPINGVINCGQEGRGVKDDSLKFKL